MKAKVPVIRLTLLIAVSLSVMPNALAQHAIPQSPQDLAQKQHQEKLEQITNDKATYASGIVSRWEDAARQSGKWDPHFSSDLYVALMKMPPENLLAAEEATSFADVMSVVATGHVQKRKQTANGALSSALGDFRDDLVYTPVTPCRIVDTRVAGGPIAANGARGFDVDGSTFVEQGGNNGSCGIPFGVASAVAMTLTATQPATGGYLTAWSIGSAQPNSSVLNFAAGQTIANTSIVPVLPGSGNDFVVFSSATTEVVIDVVGFFAAPIATAADCTTVNSAVVAADVDVWTAIDAGCPAGYTVTGGGYNTTEGSLGYPGVWLTSLPNGANGWRVWVDNQTNGPRHILTYAQCCRVPGR